MLLSVCVDPLNEGKDIVMPFLFFLVKICLSSFVLCFCALPFEGKRKVEVKK